MHGVHSPDLMFKNYIENSPSIFFMKVTLQIPGNKTLFVSGIFNQCVKYFKIFLNKGLLLMSLKILAIFVTDKN